MSHEFGPAHPEYTTIRVGLRVGDILHGFCGGTFGRDFWGPARVEAIGTDWVVVRHEYRGVYLHEGSPEELLDYLTQEDDG